LEGQGESFYRQGLFFSQQLNTDRAPLQRLVAGYCQNFALWVVVHQLMTGDRQILSKAVQTYPGFANAVPGKKLTVASQGNQRLILNKQALNQIGAVTFQHRYQITAAVPQSQAGV